MRKELDGSKKRKSTSITIDNELYKIIENTTSNKSRYISWLLIEKLNDLGIDVSKIKL